MGFDLTPEQKAAVEYRGGTLLVSAAAGSGKTKVLVERLLGHIEDGNEIGEYLVITYTRAAAAELRTRIQDQIQERLAGAPDNKKLRRQSILCRAAPIDTIHGFCGDILRENADLAGLAPDFRVADESEGDIIKAEVLESVLDAAYENIGAADGFRQLINMTSPGRDDKMTAGIVLDTYAKLRSNPSPGTWLEEQRKRLRPGDVSDVSSTIWGAYLMDKSRDTAAFRLGELEGLRRDMRGTPDFKKAYGGCVDASIVDIRAFLGALDGGWDEARRHSTIDFSRVKPNRISGYDDEKAVRNRCKAAMGKIADVFAYPSTDHIDDICAIAPAITALIDLLLDFDSAYMKEKRRRGIVDFSDLEHLALNLLIDKETGVKTALAQSLSGRYKEIMVDEYQDVNAVQESIFNAISNGGNIFMVGDVKQSIYRFRLADPSIFLEKYLSFEDAGGMTPEDRDCGESPDDDEGDGKQQSLGHETVVGAKILLSRNFRSRATILNAANFVFDKIMSMGSGELDYTEREHLAAGRDDAAGGPAAALEIIDMSGIEKGDEDEESPAGTQIEAQHIARRIAELTSGGYTIPGGDSGERNITYSDIVILLRSMRDKAWQYAAALTDVGIPVDFPGGEGFYSTIEISAVLSILAVIDNPLQEIPLVAALSGPVYGFTPDELSAIRCGSRDSDFYCALLKASVTARGDNDDPGLLPHGLKEKCAAFLAEIDGFRETMPDTPADRFIWHVYNKTGLIGRVGAMRGGERRRKNLLLLAERARVYEQNGYRGLFSFLSYISSLQERGVDIPGDQMTPISGASAGNAVRIISIHKSKGLEFPVVFLANTSKQFNNMDAQKPLVMHSKLGFGPKRTDNDRKIEYTTLARMAVQSKLTSEMLAEEMRILYVAMTRARERLIVTAAYADAGKVAQRVSSAVFQMMRKGGEQISPQIVNGSKSMAEWILLALATDAGQEAWEVNVIPASQVQTDKSIGITAPWDTGTRLNNGQPPHDIHPTLTDTGDDLPDAVPGRTRAAVTAKPEDVKMLGERFCFAYPYTEAPDMPSKMTVTGLKDRDFDREAAVLGKKSFTYRVPGFIAENRELSGAERGVAMHLVMQHIDFKKCVSVTAIGDEIGRLTELGLLNEKQAAAVDKQKIARFFESDVGRRAQKAEEVTREFRFSLLYPAGRFFPGGGEDKILLQGVIDCFFEEGGEVSIIDFKTDAVTRDKLEEKVKHYTPQLTAYSESLKRITRKHIGKCVLYFFELNCGVEV